jgi:predicted NBD/HSP70 family sugar kinase
MLDPGSGSTLIWSEVSGWRNVQLKRIFAEKYRLTTVVEDTARATACAEQRFGYAKGVTNFVFVHAGLGIGAAIFVDGHLYHGGKGLAGELGHTMTNENGPLCSCGSRGCLEIYASGSAIIDKVREGLERGVAANVTELAAGDHQDLSLEAIALAAQSHDRLSETVLREAGTHIGMALANVVNLLNPSRIIMGGILPRLTKNLLLEPLQQALRFRALQYSVADLDVVISELGEEATAVGVGILATEQIFDNLCTLIQTREYTPGAMKFRHEEL